LENGRAPVASKETRYRDISNEGAPIMGSLNNGDIEFLA
jgi:hypothetical protein